MIKRILAVALLAVAAVTAGATDCLDLVDQRVTADGIRVPAEAVSLTEDSHGQAWIRITMSASDWASSQWLMRRERRIVWTRSCGQYPTWILTDDVRDMTFSGVLVPSEDIVIVLMERTQPAARGGERRLQ